MKNKKLKKGLKHCSDNATTCDERCPLHNERDCRALLIESAYRRIKKLEKKIKQLNDGGNQEDEYKNPLVDDDNPNWRAANPEKYGIKR